MKRKPKQTRRAGMTILEVLFAIMITSIGLLGAVAVFPVASEYARKGRLNDEVTVCAESAVHVMDARGMRRPDHWITWRYVNNQWVMVSGPGMVQAGESYCLDPRFLTFARPGEPVGNLMSTGNPSPPAVPTYTTGEATWFPAFPRRNTLNGGVPFSNNDPDFNGNPGAPRMQRITLCTGSNTSYAPYGPDTFLLSSIMGRFQADHVFSFLDQLTYERPGVQKGSIARSDNALPAFQLYSPIKTGGSILPGRREDDGKLSWMATLVPKIDRWNATLEDKYVLSIVVFYNRSPNLVIPDFTQALNRPVNEWTGVILGVSTTVQPSPQPTPPVSDFHSLGYGGGEVTITATGSADKLKMRSGDWVMLSARVAAGATTVPTYKWYRISDADEDPYQDSLGNWKRDVTLVGPDWDLQDVLPINNNAPAPNQQFDDVEVTIVPNIIAVFDRTVRLELDGAGY